MKRLFAVALGILTAIGGFVDIGDIVANTETGARFGMSLAWVVGGGVVGGWVGGAGAAVVVVAPSPPPDPPLRTVVVVAAEGLAVEPLENPLPEPVPGMAK